MIRIDDELLELMGQYDEMFDEGIGLMQIPTSETTENLKRNIRRCLKEEKDLLPEIYKFDDSGNNLF